MSSVDARTTRERNGETIFRGGIQRKFGDRGPRSATGKFCTGTHGNGDLSSVSRALGANDLSRFQPEIRTGEGPGFFRAAARGLYFEIQSTKLHW